MSIRADYGYDAPYFPLLFGFLSVAAGLAAAILWWGNPIAATTLITASKAPE